MATKADCAFCFDVIVAHFEHRVPIALKTFRDSLTRSTERPSGDHRHPADVNKLDKGSTEQYPIFITWSTYVKGQKRLRGCIGTFEPQPLAQGLMSYAKIAAFDDNRFNPISRKELEHLECGVSLLTDFEEASDPFDWEWGVHGIRISFIVSGRRYSATYLPDVPPEHFNSKEETIISLIDKAGYMGSKFRDLNIKLVRYKSSKEYLLYADYITIKNAL
ncbi:AMMECR1 domain-containing protein [Dipodascopsis uninucleata]